jgi:hypothetical protein
LKKCVIIDVFAGLSSPGSNVAQKSPGVFWFWVFTRGNV